MNLEELICRDLVAVVLPKRALRDGKKNKQDERDREMNLERCVEIKIRVTKCREKAEDDGEKT